MDLVGGRGLPRQLCFENFVCQNERIWIPREACAKHAPLDPPMQGTHVFWIALRDFCKKLCSCHRWNNVKKWSCNFIVKVQRCARVRLIDIPVMLWTAVLPNRAESCSLIYQLYLLAKVCTRGRFPCDASCPNRASIAQIGASHRWSKRSAAELYVRKASSTRDTRELIDLYGDVA